MRRNRSSIQVRGPATIGLLMVAASWVLFTDVRPVRASDAAGVYSLVEDIALEADPARPDEPLRIRIYGIHALSFRPQSGAQRGQGIYTEPAAGHLYFACGPGDAETCRLEWQDLLKAVGSDRCAAFGNRYLTDPRPNGRLRLADEAPAQPDPYPIGQGVLMVRQGDVNTCEALHAVADARVTPAAVPSPDPATELPPTDQPLPPPTAKPAATDAPPEGKPSPNPGKTPPPGVLFLPRVQGHGDGAGQPAAAPDPSRKASLPDRGARTDRRGRAISGSYALLLLSVLGTGLVGARGRRRRP